jgi:hypothetical protein
MGEVLINGLMEDTIQGSGFKIGYMAMESMCGQMENFMRDTIKMMLKMAMECITIQMAKSILGIGKMEHNMELE